jgi:hypothetical protein
MRKLDNLINTDGIIAVTYTTDFSAYDEVGEPAWKDLLRDALQIMRRRPGATRARLIIGSRTFDEHSIVLQREGKMVVAVVSPVGHAVQKSIHRAIERAVKHLRVEVERGVAEMQPQAEAPAWNPPAPSRPQADACNASSAEDALKIMVASQAKPEPQPEPQPSSEIDAQAAFR